MTSEELFGKHFNGLHYEDITKERIQKYAIDFAKMHVTQFKEELIKTVDECQANGLKMDVKMLESIININFINQWTQLEN